MIKGKLSFRTVLSGNETNDFTGEPAKPADVEVTVDYEAGDGENPSTYSVTVNRDGKVSTLEVPSRTVGEEYIIDAIQAFNVLGIAVGMHSGRGSN